MEIFLAALEYTLSLVFRLGSIMFFSLFGIELFMQMGLMRYLKPVGRPVARLARLPSESAVSFLAAVGSMIAAHTLAAQFHSDGRLTDRQLRLTGVLNTVPFHIKETLTFQLPVVLPLLGTRLSIIYITAFWLTGVLKLLFVLAWGRLASVTDAGREDAFDALECDPENPKCVNRNFITLVMASWHARKKMFFKMIGVLGLVTLAIQILALSGMLGWVEKGIAPMTSALGLPPAVLGPVTAYLFSPTVGITFMSNIIAQGGVTPYEAITALMAGGLLMIPVTRLRRTLPRYVAIFGIKNGTAICCITMGFAMLSRVIVLIWVMIYFV